MLRECVRPYGCLKASTVGRNTLEAALLLELESLFSCTGGEYEVEHEKSVR